MRIAAAGPGRAECRHFYRASDHGALDYPDRVTDWHLADIHQVLAAVRQRAPGLLWLMGTSRGTV